MTETASGPARTARKGKGLKMERVFSTDGVHPYDEITWERRDVVQQNWKTGETVFEQKGVEFPDFWSVNASTIVTTKYFRGAVGTDAREWSLKQLVDRVVKTYRKGGEDHGYFASPADAELFEHELTWLLVHQYFSFNSPVWFNVGTQSPQQVSACFILSVDDSMESILSWNTKEGMIFRGGSGPYGMKNALTWDDLQTYWKAKEAEGRSSLVDIAAYSDGGKELWDIALGAGQGKLTPKLEAAAFAKDWNDRLAQGFADLVGIDHDRLRNSGN